MTRTYRTLAIAALLALTSTGCLVVTRTRTTTRTTGIVKGQVIHGSVRAVLLAAKASSSAIRIHTTAQRDCRQEVRDVLEVTRTRHAKLDLGNNDDSNAVARDPRGKIFAFALAPLTLPVSALIAGVRVAASGTRKTTETRFQRMDRFACATDAPAIAVELRFPSGTAIAGITDPTGALAVEIPELEPYRGIVTATAAGVAPREIRYQRPTPAVTLVRDGVLACAATHGLTGVVELRLVVDPAGRISDVELAPGDAAFAACVRAAIEPARFPDAQRNATVVFPFQLAFAPALTIAPVDFSSELTVSSRP